MRKLPKSILIIISLIILLGLFLRVHDLDQESLWVDEIYSVQYAQSPNLMGSIGQTEGAPPGHYLLLKYWITIFGSSVVSVRFLSVIFGVLSIPLIFRIGDLLFNRKVGIIASSLLATSMLQVLYSQEARLYAMFGFLTLLTIYFFTAAILRENFNHESKKYYVFYGISMLLAIYTNYLAVGLVILLFLIAIWFKGVTKLKKWLITNLIIALLSLPLIPLIIKQFFVNNTGLSSALITKGLPSFLAHFGLFFYALPLLILLAIATFLVWNKTTLKNLLKLNFPDSFFTILLVLFSFVYIYLVLKPLTIFGVNLTSSPITHSYFLIRHSFFLVPILYLLVAYRISKINSKKLFIFSIVLLLLVNLFSLGVYYSQPTKAQFKEAMIFIDENSRSRPLILLDRGGFAATNLAKTYSDAQLISLTWTQGRRQAMNIDQELLFQKTANREEFWLILFRNMDTGYFYKDLIKEKYTLELSAEFYQIEVFKYSRD